MKLKPLTSLVLILLSLNTLHVKAQDQQEPAPSGLPGDNFSLQGALEMFKKASSPEEFEKLLNAEENKVNNLDLNQDGTTDYIKVINKRENDVQIFVLQDQVSEKESQDIAVIELEKTGKENAVIQIVGDEDIFGEETIVEPGTNEQTAYNQGMRGGPNVENDSYFSPTGIVVNVWAWPCVRFVYAPAYTVWVSPWSWHAHPLWWRPWRPFAWVVYRPYRYHYAPHYTVVTTRRVVYAPRIYRPMRVTSVTVTTRHRGAVSNYRVARKTTTVRTHHGKHTRTTTVVRRRRR
jgi:hypothetical protein